MRPPAHSAGSPTQARAMVAKPAGVTFAQVDRATGLRAVAGRESELEVFVKGSEPTEYAAAAEEEPAHPELEQDGVLEGTD